MPHRSRALLLFMLCLLLSAAAIAQSALAGAIGGVVRDPLRAAVQGATLHVQNAENGARYAASTGADGSYRFPELKPGLYLLTAESKGFVPLRRQEIRVEVGRLTEVNLDFALEGHRETVEVREEAADVNHTQPDFALNVVDAAIDNLPINGRRWSNFALLAPTANLDDNFGLLSFRGINGVMNSITLDGADNNQAFMGEERGGTRISYVISQASIREFQVNTANYSAEYGGAAGAVVNSVTRSGGNRLRGELFFFDRDNAMGASNAFTQVPVPVTFANNTPTSWTARQIKPLDRRLQFGGNAGGPIVKDQLFYFASVDAQRRDYPAIAAATDTPSLLGAPCVNATHYNQIATYDAADLGNVRLCSSDPKSTADELNTLIKNVLPLGSTNHDEVMAFDGGLQYLASLLGRVPRTSRHNIAFAKVDYHIDARKLLSLSMNRMRWSSPGGAQSQPVVHRGVDSFGFDGVKTDTAIARFSVILSPRAAVELRYSYGRDFEYQVPQRPAPGEPVKADGLAPEISVLGSSSGFSFGTPYSQPRRAFPDEYRNQIAGRLSWMHGHHYLKFGGDYSHVRDGMNNLLDANGSYSYSKRDYFIADLCQWTGGPLTAYCSSRYGLSSYFRGYSSFTLGFGSRALRFHTNDLAFYAQEEWRLLRRLTVSAGLRYERELLPSPQLPNPLLPGTASFPSDGNNFAPRVGFAWDATSDGRTVLRGGYGIFYGRILNSTIASAITRTGTADAQRSYTFCYKTSAHCSLQGPVFPAVDSVSDPYTPAQGGNVVEFAPHAQLPQIHQVDLILERQVARNTVVSASYLLSLGRELPAYVDSNLDPSSRVTVGYTFKPDHYSKVAGPLDGQTLYVPVYTQRLNPNFEAITQIRSNVNSTYSALVLQCNRTLRAGLDFRLSYTWAHAIDGGQSSTTFSARNNTASPAPYSYWLGTGAPVLVRHPDYGTSNYDIRQHFTGSVYITPRFGGTQGFVRAALEHWTVAPIVQISTGRPYSDSISGDAPPVKGPDDLIPGNCAGCLGFMGAGGGQYRLPPLGRNSFRYGNFYNTDLRLSRRIYFHEHHDLELVAEAFNVFNHQNITGRHSALYSVYTPYSTTPNPTTSTLEYDSRFGTPTSAASTIYREREIQLGARVHF